MNINFKEAKELNPALAPNPFEVDGLTWLPLKEVKSLDNNLKYETALQLMNNWLENKNKQKQNQMTNSTKIKIIDYSIAGVFILLLTTSHFNLPPSSYFISMYCKAMNTDLYSPLMIGAVFSLVYAVPAYLIKKKLESKTDK